MSRTVVVITGCEPVHAISADPGPAAERVLSGTRTVNSIHHQAVAVTNPYFFRGGHSSCKRP